jgi:hypothetical protein
MKPVKVHTRCDCQKPTGYIDRNWPKASIKLKEKAEAKAAERAAAKAAKEAKLAEKLAQSVESDSVLERSPLADFVEFSK